jgi:hypothetical protein
MQRGFNKQQSFGLTQGLTNEAFEHAEREEKKKAETPSHTRKSYPRRFQAFLMG